MTLSIAFYKGRRSENPKARPFDILTCWWTKSRFSHCELVDSEGTCWSSSLRDHGVRGKKIDLTNGRWELVEINGDEAKAVAWFVEHTGAPYDVSGLFGFVLPWRTHVQDHWFCSEAVAEALNIERSWDKSPEDLRVFMLARRELMADVGPA